MNILVTGIKGFIGSHVADKFRECYNTVYGIATSSIDTDDSIYSCDLVTDNCDEFLITVKPDIIVHCAGLADVSYSVTHVQEDYCANTTLTYRLLETVRRCKLNQTRILLLSSAAVYGQPERLPISEHDALHPMSPYALHKRLAEEICEYYRERYKLDVQILRVFSAYGPGLKKQIFWDMYEKIQKYGCLDLYGTGKESRDYIYIDDLVDAIYLIATQSSVNCHVWNVANGQEHSIHDVAHIYARIYGLREDRIAFNGCLRQGDPINWCADISKLQELGYKNKISIEEGIRRYINWVKEKR